MGSQRPPGDLDELERLLDQAFQDGSTPLPVLGHGEISLVVGWPPDSPRWACKRLPPFPDLAGARRHQALIDQYVTRLDERGVQVLETHSQVVDGRDGLAVVYCVQPAVPPETLAPVALAAEPALAGEILPRIVEHIAATVDERLGLDAQLSNWVVDGPSLHQIDVSTPLLRDHHGVDLIDTRVLVQTLPWLARGAVRRFLAPSITGRYHDPRLVVLDLSANLIKEGLDDHIDIVLESARGVVEPPIDRTEVERDYRADARMWEAVQRLRRADRWWQTHVRRRPYPFLLPEPVDRRI